MIDNFPAHELPDEFPAHELPVTTKPQRGPYAKTERFPCEPCRGTGRFLGARVHQPESKCFACGGKGYFMTSAADRMKARQGRQVSKARKLTEARAAFDEQNPGIADFLASVADWNNFARELQGKLAQYGYLTEGQVAAVRRTKAKIEENRRARALAREAASLTVDLSSIRTMFEKAVANGYKKPIYRAAGLVINRASDFGKNPGALYVKSDEGDYLGKIIGTDYTGKPAPSLTAIAADPRGEAIKYGQRTGTCSCCGRTLTNEGSIEAGIGPICASKWGL